MLSTYCVIHEWASVTATPVQTACIDIIWNNIVTLHDASMVALSYAPNIYWKITVTDLLWPSTELKVFLTWWIQNSTRWQLVGHSTVLLHSNILNRLNWLNQLNRPMRMIHWVTDTHLAAYFVTQTKRRYLPTTLLGSKMRIYYKTTCFILCPTHFSSRLFQNIHFDFKTFKWRL